MSNDSKGTRKTSKGSKKEKPATGKLKLSTELLISLLVAGLYALFLVDTRLDQGIMPVFLSGFLIAAFLVFALIVRGGKHRMKQEFGSLLYVFLGLSVLSFVWELLLYASVIDATKMSTTTWITIVGLINAVVSIIIVAAIAYFEKSSPAELYITMGDRKVIPFAVIAFILCAVMGIGATYFLFGGAALGTVLLAQFILAVLAFGVLSGVYEELLFRGIMLSRIVPILGESHGNIYQALVFGVFEAVIFYTLTGQLTLMPAMFIIGAMTGYYWGRATLRSKSLISPILLHAGFYMLVVLPIMAGLSA